MFLQLSSPRNRKLHKEAYNLDGTFTKEKGWKFSVFESQENCPNNTGDLKWAVTTVRLLVILTILNTTGFNQSQKNFSYFPVYLKLLFYNMLIFAKGHAIICHIFDMQLDENVSGSMIHGLLLLQICKPKCFLSFLISSQVSRKVNGYFIL